jgi:CheY-like chemotaxis protein
MSSPGLAWPTIVIAEDNKYDRMILDEAFAELDFQVSLKFVSDGEELLDYLLKCNEYRDDNSVTAPILILMDLNMARMGGIEATRALRADVTLRVLPIIVLSTSDSPGQISQAYASGVNSFLTKPCHFDDLVELLRRFGTYWLESARLPNLSAVPQGM